jgi:hypothetical protein
LSWIPLLNSASPRLDRQTSWFQSLLSWIPLLNIMAPEEIQLTGAVAVPDPTR